MVITSTRALPLTLMLLGGGATTLQFRAPVLVLHVNGSANTGGDPGLQPDSFVALDAAGKHLFGSSQSAHHPWHSSDSGATWRLGGEVSVGPVLSSRGGAFYGLTRTSPMGSAHALGIGPPPWFAEKGVNVGCDATSTRHCPGLACDLTHSPIALEISINASNGALLMIDTCRQVSHTLPPHLLNRSIGLYNHRGAQPTDAVRLQDGTFVQIIPIQLAGETPSVPFPGSPASTTTYPTSLVAFTSQDGYAWEFASIVASKQTNLPWSFYGPTEFDLTLLADNKTLLAVFRPDSDSSCPGEPKYRWYHQACESSTTTYQYKVRSGVFSPFHSSTNYARSTAPVDMVADSTDGGKQWSSPRPIPGAGCVRPKLLLLPGGGPLLLLGGRLCKHLNLDAQQCMPSSGGAGSRDVGAESILLWVNDDGMADHAGERNGSEWRKVCLTAEHNRLWQGGAELLFNESTATQSYGSIVPLAGKDGEQSRSAGVFYQHGWQSTGTPIATFMMRVDITTAVDEDQVVAVAGAPDNSTAQD